jgi:hypothetical protein
MTKAWSRFIYKFAWGKSVWQVTSISKEQYEMWFYIGRVKKDGYYGNTICIGPIHFIFAFLRKRNK